MRKRVVLVAGLVFAPATAPMVAHAEGRVPAGSAGRVPAPPPPETTAPPVATLPESTESTAPPETAPAPDSTTTTTTSVPAAPTTTAVPEPTTTTHAPETTVVVPTTTVPESTGPDLGPESTLLPHQSGPDGAHLAASIYDKVYANGLPLGTAMATSRFLESGNNYQAQAAKASASGAYQIIDQSWNNYGGYPGAYLAPPAVQDQFAYEQFVEILKRNGNNLAAIPVAWYYPAALSNPELMDVVPMPEAGNRLTIREYQTKWLTKFFELLEQGAPPFLPSDTDPLIPAIAFPVLGPVNFSHDYGAPRGEHGERFHEGLDLIGLTGQPLRAAFDGVVTRVRLTPDGISGVVLTITRSDGLRANYFHVNDDIPGGGNDNSAPAGLRIHPHLAVGDTVKAGQIVAYMGNTGNAVHIPHLHFELRTPEGIPVDPYPAVLAAQQREQCSVGIGPWSTDFFSPTEAAKFHADFATLPPQTRADLIAMAAATPVPVPVVHRIIGPDGARWEIDEGGNVRAVGASAVIQPGSGACEKLPPLDVVYGSDSSGVGRDLLPTDWWEIGVAYGGPVVDDDLGGGDGTSDPAAADDEWATSTPPSSAGVNRQNEIVPVVGSR